MFLEVILVQVIAAIPAYAQAICGEPHQLPLEAQTLEVHHQLQPDEDHRVDARSIHRGAALLDEVAHDGEVERPVPATVEVVARDKIL